MYEHGTYSRRAVVCFYICNVHLSLQTPTIDLYKNVYITQTHKNQTKTIKPRTKPHHMTHHWYGTGFQKLFLLSTYNLGAPVHPSASPSPLSQIFSQKKLTRRVTHFVTIVFFSFFKERMEHRKGEHGPQLDNQGWWLLSLKGDFRFLMNKTVHDSCCITSQRQQVLSNCPCSILK